MGSELPEAVKAAYEVEIKRLDGLLKTATGNEAESLKESIRDLEAELIVEDWPLED